MHAVGARICIHSRKKQRGEFSPGTYRCRIDRAPGVENLQQLLARAVVVPSPVAFDDFNELGGRRLAPVLGIEGDGEIESRLMVAGIGRDLSHQLGSVAASRRLGRAPSFCREASARRPPAATRQLSMTTVHKKDSTMNGHTGMLVAIPRVFDPTITRLVDL